MLARIIRKKRVWEGEERPPSLRGDSLSSNGDGLRTGIAEQVDVVGVENAAHGLTLGVRARLIGSGGDRSQDSHGSEELHIEIVRCVCVSSVCSRKKA